MLVSDFDYELPEESIAKYPPQTRGTTKLLVLKQGEITDSKYLDLAKWLKPGDLVILNDTKVMRARLFAKLPDGRSRQLVVLEAHSLNTSANERTVMYRGKLHQNDELTITDNHANESTGITVKIVEILGNGLAKIQLLDRSSQTIDELVEKYGTVPLPPYLKREAEQADIERYQTVWAKRLGSAAAPTASLNMTSEIMQSLRDKNIEIRCLTLHVGLGTFLPIRSDEVEAHQMHAEFFQIPAATLAAIQQAKSRGGRIVAVGTTVARTLEFWAKTGQAEGEDDIFIYPGFDFKVVDVLLTNFHAPKSTVLMLATAFAGRDGANRAEKVKLGWQRLKSAYDYAIKNDYKLLSYGDSMLIC